MRRAKEGSMHLQAHQGAIEGDGTHLGGDQAKLLQDLNVVESAARVVLQVLVCEEGSEYSVPTSFSYHLQHTVLHIREAGQTGHSVSRNEGMGSQLRATDKDHSSFAVPTDIQHQNQESFQFHVQKNPATHFATLSKMTRITKDSVFSKTTLHISRANTFMVTS